jgi:RNA polymerase sigma factor (TIGR02999 family)
MARSPNDITRMLEAVRRGEEGADNELILEVYRELRRIAAAKLSREAPGHTLQPTALVHEAWMRFGDAKNQPWENRSQFFAAAAEAMRRILIESARRRKAQRRGGGEVPLNLDDLDIAIPIKSDELLAVDEALDRFALLDREKAELVKLRFFVGMTIEEAADALGIARATATRHWTYARAWFYKEIQDRSAR